MALAKSLVPVWIFMLEVFWGCHPNADSYRDLTPKQIYKKHDNEKKRKSAERVMEIKQGKFTPLVFTTTVGMADKCVGMADKCVGMADKCVGMADKCVGMADKCVGMADKCVKYHSRLAELIANKKGESYSSAISWIRTKVSFAIVRYVILCLRGSIILEPARINLFKGLFLKEVGT